MEIATLKEQTVDRLISAHFEVESGLVRICRLERDAKREQWPTEPIKLLEVNERTFPGGLHGVPLGADPEAGFFFPCLVYEVTPEEFEDIERGVLSLPNGLRITDRFERPAMIGGPVQ